MATVLLCGARGMLGQRLLEAFREAHLVIPSGREGGAGLLGLDIADEAQVDSAMRIHRPDWVLNAAAYTAVDRAESEPELAHRTNALGPGVLAKLASAHGAKLLHVSTDFVFDGEKGVPYVETDPVGPIGVYARTKAAGEARVAAVAGPHVILRIAWLFGRGGKNFVATMLRLARERSEMRVVADQWGTPTSTHSAARMAVRVMEAGLEGTIHAANRGVTTWHGLALETFRRAGIRIPVIPISTSEYPTPATRPRNSALSNEVLERTIGDSMGPWQDALAHYLEEGA